MDAKKKARLVAGGWTTGSADEFLGLTAEESALIDTKMALSGLVRTERERAGLTQTTLAVRIGSSQSRIAKIEKGDPSVSLDLLFRAAFAAGAKPDTIGRAISHCRPSSGRTSQAPLRSRRAAKA